MRTWKSGAALAVALGLVLMAGCGGVTATTPPIVTPPPITTPPAPTAAKNIYVIQNSPNDFAATVSDQILVFSASDNGASTPTQTITGPAGYLLGTIAVDTSGNIYVAGWTATRTTTTIFVYAATATGAATPVRTINSAVLSGTVLGMAFDSAGSLYASVMGVGAGYGAITEFNATASGPNVAPVNVITLDAAQVQYPGALTVGSDGTIYTSTLPTSGNAQVLAFAPGAQGSVLPVRTIGGSNTGIQPAVAFMGIDSTNNLYVSSEDATTNASSIHVFPGTANGNIAPTSVIGGSALGSIDGIGGIAVDPVGNVYGVAISSVPSGYAPVYFFSYAAGATGNAAPQTRGTSSAYSFSSLFGTIAVH